MGGYGTSVGETKNYQLILMVNCSGDKDTYAFNLFNKTTKEYYPLYSCDNDKMNEDFEEMNKFNSEVDEEYNLFWLSDKGIRDKVKFESEFRKLEEKNKELLRRYTAIEVKLESIRKLIK